MSAKAFFSNKTGICRLEVCYPHGNVLKVLFEHVSSMVNFCNEVGIDVHGVNCIAE